MVTIAIERECNLVRIRASGFWLRETAEAFSADLRQRLPQLGAGLGRHALLCDLSACFIAPPETVDALRSILSRPEYRPLRARHIALHTPSALFRMQLERVAQGRPGMRTFADGAAALAWIEAERMDAPAPV